MSRALAEAFAKTADGYERDAVVDAAANIILNALRQSHLRLPAAEEELADLAARMQEALRRNHYSPDGDRRGHIVVDPGLTRWLRSEGVL